MIYFDTNQVPKVLPAYSVSQLTAVIAFYHYTMNLHNGDVDWDNDTFKQPIARDILVSYINTAYDPETPILSWMRLQKDGTVEDKRQLEAWNKNVKVSSKDFPLFKDALYWNRY